ncbi:MAG: Na-K-Cl cotransporter [Gemmatimonadales bacterium]
MTQTTLPETPLARERPEADQARGGYGFGWFKGVFTPSILTILGVVMYLRLGWVLGNVGLAATLLIVTLASAITFLTGLSLAALATNMKVGGGGAYYIISRSLGLEVGAAIGLPLYLAQALGISFYVVGFSESLALTFPFLHPTAVGVTTLAVLAAVVYVSADLALRTQFVIMGAIALSLVSFLLGAPLEPAAAPAEAVRTLSFWPVFAVFFPAVTGIEAGIAMSGDLKNPARALPLGTMLAVLTGYAIYLAIPIVLHRQGVPDAVLISDPLVMQKTARWGPALLVGVWAASLSSAVGSLLGAPRTLQALARDRVVPEFLGRGYGRFNDPRLATILSFAIGLTGILLGDLNAIAPILAMFFLTSYGVLNLSAGFEELISNPAWRPQFRVPAGLSLAGFAGCLGVMLMIAPGATIIAALTCGGIYSAMKRRSMRARWGDMRLAFMMFVTRVILYRMQGRRHDERTWKPNLLVFSGVPSARWYLIELADAIAQGRSFLTVATFVSDRNWTSQRVGQITESIRSYLDKRNVPAFIHTLPAADPFEGAATMIRAYGFGPITPNTILIGETENPSSFVEFSGLIQLINRSHRNLVIVREQAETAGGEGRRRRVDLWWTDGSPQAAFMLAVAILLRRSADWRGATLCVKSIVEREEEAADVEARLQQFLREARVTATTAVLARGAADRFNVIRQSSAGADLVFLGMRPPREDESADGYSVYYEGLLRNTDAFPATALVMAGEPVDFRRIFEAT